MEFQQERLKNHEKMAENVIEKLHTMGGRKDMLIKDQDGLLEMLECLASADQAKKIATVRNFKKKIDSKS